MKIKTELLQKMVSKVIQGASNNKMIPLTSLIGIELKREAISDKSKLTLITSDGSNQFRVSDYIESEKDANNQFITFYTIVNADTFAKLVGKTTREFIELNNKENYLEVNGNGTYKLEIAINEEGEMVKFLDIPNVEYNESKMLQIKINDLQEAIKVARASVAKTMEVPCLTGYYIGKDTIATNRQLACKFDKEIVSEPILISSEMAELLLLLDGDEITLFHNDSDLIFYNANYEISGKELENKDLYPTQAIENLVALSYNNVVKVNKQELLNVLDRMSLFVTDYDKGGIYLSFTEAELIIRSQKSNAEEIIEIDSSLDPDQRFNCLLNIEMLRNEVESISTDTVELHYGQEKSIKIVDGNTTFVISLLEKAN